MLVLPRVDKVVYIVCVFVGQSLLSGLTDPITNCGQLLHFYNASKYGLDLSTVTDARGCFPLAFLRHFTYSMF